MTPQLYAILGVGLLLVVDVVILLWINNRVRETNPNLDALYRKNDALETRLDKLEEDAIRRKINIDGLKISVGTIEQSLTDLHKFVTAPKPAAPKPQPIMARNWREVQTLVGTGEDDAS